MKVFLFHQNDKYYDKFDVTSTNSSLSKSRNNQGVPKSNMIIKQIGTLLGIPIKKMYPRTY